MGRGLRQRAHRAYFLAGDCPYGTARTRLRALAAAGVFVAASACWASAASANDTVALACAAGYLPDPNDALTIDQVAQLPARAFKSCRTLDRRTHVDGYWVRLRLPTLPTDEQWFIAFSRIQGRASVYYPRAHGYAVVRTGMQVPYAQRPVRALRPAVRLTARMRGAREIYLHVGWPLFGTAFALVSERAAVGAELRDLTLTLPFAGFCLAIAVLSIFLAIYLRERDYALNALYITLTGLEALVVYGSAWQLLWPHARVDYLTALFVTRDCSGIAYVIFFTTALQAWTRSPWMTRAVSWGLLPLAVTASYLAFFVDPESNTVQMIANVLPLLFIPMGLVIAIIVLRQGYRIARFFVAGFILLELSGIVQVVMAAHGNGVLAESARYAGAGLQALFFQFGLADRVVAERRAREEAQRDRADTHERLIAVQQNAISTLEAYKRAAQRFVPQAFLEELNADLLAIHLGDHVERSMSVLFSDIRDFSEISDSMSPQDNFEFINEYLGRVGPVVRAHGGFIDKYIGDSVMALFRESASAAVAGAIMMQQEIRRLNEARARKMKRPISTGTGIHHGHMMLGTIGESEGFDTTVISSVVNVAARLEGLTKRFGAHILVSDNVAQACGGQYHMRPLGRVLVKGASRPVQILEVCDADEPAALLEKMQHLEAFEQAMNAYAAGSIPDARSIFERLGRDCPSDHAARYFAERCAQLVELGTPADWDGVERFPGK